MKYLIVYIILLFFCLFVGNASAGSPHYYFSYQGWKVCKADQKKFLVIGFLRGLQNFSKRLEAMNASAMSKEDGKIYRSVIEKFETSFMIKLIGELYKDKKMQKTPADVLMIMIIAEEYKNVKNK